MKIQHILATTLTVLTLAATTGCAVARGQQTVGAYGGAAAITAAVKARFIDNKTVDASSITVETPSGTVLLTGFAKSSAERTVAESLAWKVSGAKEVNNDIVVHG